jgi:uncharacterized membrane protein YdbT with pleckstrin-like domain
VSFNLGPGEQVVFEGHPSWRAILGFYVKGILITGVLAALVGAWGSIVGDGVDETLVLLVLLVGATITVLAGFLKRIATRYTITNRRLHIKHGIVSREVQETRLERVQDVSYTQSAWQRLLQVGDVDFDTAATDPTSFVFSGVADPGKVVEDVHRATGPDSHSGLGDGTGAATRPLERREDS